LRETEEKNLKKNPFSCSRHPLKPRGPPLPLRNRSPLLPLQSSPHFLHTSLSFPVEPPLQGLFRKRENQSSLTRTRALGIIAPTTVSSPAYHHKLRTQHFPLLAFASSRSPHFPLLNRPPLIWQQKTREPKKPQPPATVSLSWPITAPSSSR